MNIFGRLKRKLLKEKNKKRDFFLYEYSKSGIFDYERYRKIQEAGNKKKIESSWVQKEDVDFLSKKILEITRKPSFGICHGTRQGLEQKWFGDLLTCRVLGTEISETATSYPNTIQWDFHEVNPEWHQKADFVYSNSFDHSYDPGKALSAWVDTLKPDGICIIEHSQYHNPEAANELDPFGARLEIMPFLVLQWSNNDFYVKAIWEQKCTDKVTGNPAIKHYLVIQKNILLEKCHESIDNL